jgi:phosphatidylserine decarboxylase
MKFIKYLGFTVSVLVLLCVGFYKFWFLRQPARQVPHNQHQFISPANGVVVSVTHWDSSFLAVTKEKYGQVNLWTSDVDTAGTMISIQMDPTHVHYQRSPVDATILAHTHTAGDYHNALGADNLYGIRFENEHNEILLQSTDSLKYKIVQIAGFLARRIEDYIQPQQRVQQGDVIGLIKFGSQVTIILPHQVQVKAAVGSTVIDGESVLGEM